MHKLRIPMRKAVFYAFFSIFSTFSRLASFTHRQNSAIACSSSSILTPLGAMITGEYEKGYWGGQSCAVVYQDGTRMDHTEIEAGRMSPEGVCILGNWTFGEAVDLDRAAALEIGGLWIPLTGADAGVVRAD